MPKTPKTQVDPSADAAGGKEATFNIQDLQRVTTLANRILTLETEITNYQSLIEGLNEQLFQVQMVELPELMEQIGMKDFRLTTGERVLVEDIVRASIPSQSSIAKEHDADKRAEMKDRYDRALAYLSKVGASAIIKSEVVAKLGKDSDALAKKALEVLKRLKIEATVSKGVHPQTLTAWVKERLEGGKEVDMDLFGVFSGHKAKIERPKASKPISSAPIPGAKKQAGGSKSLF